MPEQPEREQADETQEALAFAKRCHKASGVALSKLESVMQKQRLAGKAPPAAKNEGRPAVE